MLSNKKIRPLSLAVILLLIAGGTSFYLRYNKPHQNIERSKAAFTLTSSELLYAFENNMLEANTIYVDQVIEVTGTIQSVDLSDLSANIILANNGDFFGINCSFSEDNIYQLKNLSKNELITVKGKCKGYIDDVLLNQCILVN